VEADPVPFRLTIQYVSVATPDFGVVKSKLITLSVAQATPGSVIVTTVSATTALGQGLVFGQPDALLDHNSTTIVPSPEEHKFILYSVMVVLAEMETRCAEYLLVSTPVETPVV
jgi:hypothetical protein